MKKLSFLLAIFMLCTLLAAPISAVAENRGMLYSLSNFESKGVKASVFLGSGTKGYPNGLLYGYLIGDKAIAEGNDYDISGWEIYENNPFQAIRLIGAAGQEAWSVDPNAFSGFEVDLGAASDIGGYVFHFSTDYWNNAEKWLGMCDFNVWTSVDGKTWTNATKISGLPIERAAYESAVDVSKYVTGGKATAGTLLKGDAYGPDKVVVGSDHPYIDVTFDKAVNARYVRVTVLTTYHHNLENNNKIDSPSFAMGFDLYKADAAQLAASKTPAPAGNKTTAPVTADLTLVAPIAAMISAAAAAVATGKRKG